MKVLKIAALIELTTGVALLVDPALAIKLLLGADAAGVESVIARVAGIAMLALGLACWPGGASAARAMLLYNVLIAPYLVYLGAVTHVGGVLLWPAAALHAVVALMLARASADDRSRATGRRD